MGILKMDCVLGKSQRRQFSLLWEKRLDELQSCFAESFTQWGFDRDRFNFYIAEKYFSFLVYLKLYFKTGNKDYLDLYLGAKMWQASDIRRDHRKDVDYALIKKEDIKCYSEVFKKEPAPILSFLEGIYNDLMKKQIKQVKVLIIGDCIFQDILLFLQPRIIRHGIELVPVFFEGRDAFAIKKELEKVQKEVFSFVFFSPFSYEFNKEYASLVEVKNCLISNRKLVAIFRNVACRTNAILKNLSAGLDCPIFVHNSFFAPRATHLWKRVIWALLLHRVTTAMAEGTDHFLRRVLGRMNKIHGKRFYIIDERRIGAAKFDFWEPYFLHTRAAHIVKWGKHLAEEYFGLIYALKTLAPKKIVVTDMDNTLWDGIIGEGPVRQYTERQSVLLSLKSKGIVLAINSKNSSKNIDYEESLLKEEDFVSRQINWESKDVNMVRIQQELNLGFGDFVFLDDSPQERALITERFPEMIVMDPHQEETWTLFRQWSRILSETGSGDRTQLYFERKQRNDFVETRRDQQDQISFFKDLRISLDIAPAQSKDLKRVEELINRTNQWNLCGSRTSRDEIQHWFKAKGHQIMLTRAVDRFGDMGIISVVLTVEYADRMEIPVFVLSCRAFGFKIETAVLNFIKRVAFQKRSPLRGKFVSTPRNEVSSSMYPDHGFRQADGYWYYDDWEKAIEDPEWLNVNHGKTKTSSRD